nr:MAG TPA: hypothetical protein [Caudoviricetes sp.]
MQQPAWPSILHSPTVCSSADFMLECNDADSLRFKYAFPVDTVSQFSPGCGFRIRLHCAGESNSPWMEDKCLAVDEVIHTGAFLLIAVHFSRYKSNRIAIAVCHSTFTEEVGGINTICYRASVVHNDTAALVGVEFHRSRISFSGDEVALLQVSLGCRMHSHCSELALCIAQELKCINKRRCGDVCRGTGSSGDIQHMVLHGVSREDAGQFIDQFFLHVTSPETCHKGTNSSHWVSTCHSCCQVGSRPHLGTADSDCHVLAGADFICSQVSTFNYVFRIPGKVFKERHIMNRRCFRCKSIEMSVIGYNAGLEQCRQFHGSAGYIRVKDFRYDDIGKSSSCHLRFLLSFQIFTPAAAAMALACSGLSLSILPCSVRLNVSLAKGFFSGFPLPPAGSYFGGFFALKRKGFPFSRAFSCSSRPVTFPSSPRMSFSLSNRPDTMSTSWALSRIAILMASFRRRSFILASASSMDFLLSS